MSKEFALLLKEVAAGPIPKHLRMALRRSSDSLKNAHRMMDQHVRDLKDDEGQDRTHHRKLLSYAGDHLDDCKHHLDEAKFVSNHMKVPIPDLKERVKSLKEAIHQHEALKEAHRKRYLFLS